MNAFRFIALLLSLLLLAACNKPSSSTQTEVKGQAFLFRASDFNLEAVISLIKGNQIKDASELEKRLNKGSDLSNVDLDQDGVIDYIQVKESRGAKGVTLDFLAIPSANPKEDEAELVASLTFSQNAASKDVQVYGGYPGYAQGGGSLFYSGVIPHSGFSFGDAFFLAWLFSPGRSLFYQPFMPMYYMPRPVVPYSQRPYRPQTSGFKQSARPSNYTTNETLKTRKNSAQPYRLRTPTTPQRSRSFSPMRTQPSRGFFRSGGGRSFRGRR